MNPYTLCQNCMIYGAMEESDSLLYCYTKNIGNMFLKSFAVWLVGKEMSQYEAAQKLEIDKRVFAYEKQKQAEMNLLATKCASDTANYEHTFHYAKEVKGIELAKLDGQIEKLKYNAELTAQLNAAENVGLQKLLDAKDKEIERLTKLVDTLSKNIVTGSVVNKQVIK